MWQGRGEEKDGAEASIIRNPSLRGGGWRGKKREARQRNSRRKYYSREGQEKKEKTSITTWEKPARNISYHQGSTRERFQGDLLESRNGEKEEWVLAFPEISIGVNFLGNGRE